MAERFDLLILGAGSSAFAAALRAAELGKTAVMTAVFPISAARSAAAKADEPEPRISKSNRSVNSATSIAYRQCRPACAYERCSAAGVSACSSSARTVQESSSRACSATRSWAMRNKARTRSSARR